jgi:RimJ/RimL family protein N-acetyltransferase
MGEPALADDVIRLRPWQLTDAEWYADAAMDPMIQRFTSEPPALTAEDVRDAIAGLAEKTTSTASFVICALVTGERLGNIGLVHEAAVAEVSYWLAAGARGRGVATRALRLISRWAFDRIGLDEIRLWTHVGNLASRKVAERAGFHRSPEHDRERQVKGTNWWTVAYCTRSADEAAEP